MPRVLIRRSAAALAFALALAATPAAAQFNDGYNFLEAVKDRDGTEATKLLDKPGSTLVNTSDLTTGETALHVVLRRRDETWTRFLLERGANPNKADKRGATPLSIAAGLGFVEGVELLLKRGAHIDVPDGTGETPLIAAVHKRDIPIIRLLLKKGADADRPDNSGRSARDYAKLMGSSAGILGEIERAEAERKASPGQETYGPGL
jgi:ankyrin repeat protein